MAFNGEMTAVIGAGVMGEAMIKGLLKQRLLAPENIVASDPRADHLEALRGRYGIEATRDNASAARAADVLVLAVKPQVMDAVLPELRGQVDGVRLILSIVAGVTIKTISDNLLNVRVVRSMPNTPGQIGNGITVWTASPEVGAEERAQAEALLGAMGEHIYASDERFLDMATALSGSGPAYVFMFMEALVDAGVHMGFARRDAEQLVTQTLLGSVLYARQSGLHPAQLRNQVTSPGGTTAAALHEMEKGGLRTVLSEGVWAAYRRSQALGSQPD
ncbi:MAG: pyrroline-5-carboxylate reductase [Chloroflexota bacterium]|nr:pyrroline-5-carboxylate reductase [Chloroflexota bacterium]MDE2908062.1 pyrroline-5-carboxylate reductase [Chloroflexota bacterium]